MDRQSIAQAAAALVLLAALVRWLPPAAPGDLLGRGDPWRLLAAVRDAARDPDAPLVVAGLRNTMEPSDPAQAALSRANVEHWAELVRLVRELRARAAAGQVVQVRNVVRNDLWMLAYDLYPLRVVGESHEQGSRRETPVEPRADWVLTGCMLRPRARCELQPADEARGGGP